MFFLKPKEQIEVQKITEKISQYQRWYCKTKPQKLKGKLCFCMNESVCVHVLMYASRRFHMPFNRCSSLQISPVQPCQKAFGCSDQVHYGGKKVIG